MDGNSAASLTVGVAAPDFDLFNANGQGSVSLAELRQRGPVIVEFVRGVW